MNNADGHRGRHELAPKVERMGSQFHQKKNKGSQHNIGRIASPHKPNSSYILNTHIISMTNNETTTTATATRTLDEEVRTFRETDEDLLSEHGTHTTNSIPNSIPNASSTNSSNNNYHFVPLRMGGRGRTHVPTSESASLIDDIGGLPTLEKMTNSFYDKAFRDVTLDKLIRSHDDPHGSRFARWIHQKLTGSTAWDEERATRSNVPVEVANGHTIVVHDRTSAHVAAWHSPKRPSHEVGRHFKLDECRVWMRLHFWALRECNLDKTFVDYYIRFIGHFVSVYEGSAPAFARDSYRWSADPNNIDKYVEDGYKMNDVLGLSLGSALAQIPEEEANDDVWPYHQYDDEHQAVA